MSKREFHSTKEIMEENFPRAVKLRKLKMETPGEFGSRIAAETIRDVKKMLEEDEKK